VLKLYRFSETEKEYWETWEHNGDHIIHSGKLGTRGELQTIKGGLFKSALSTLESRIDAAIEAGFTPIDPEDHAVLMIEYSIEGMGSSADLDKRHALEERMNETLGWTGLGACDGGSTGNGTMEVCNFVVDFCVARAVVETDLRDTDFANYTRIYEESAD
jgi:hypothetical protein